MASVNGGFVLLSHKMIEILELLLVQDYVSGSEIAQHLDISEKTARSRMGELMEALADAPAQIEVKKGKGYRLVYEDSGRFTQWFQENANLGDQSIPQTAEERLLYIIEVLLSKNRSVKRQELCDQLFVSEKTISADFKQIGAQLEQFGLRLEKSKIGVSIEGTETQKRMCILGMPGLMNRICKSTATSECREQIGALIKKSLAGKCSEYGRRQLMDYLLVMMERNRSGIFVEADQVDDAIPVDVAKTLMEALLHAGILTEVRREEVFYLSLYLKVGLMQGWNSSRVTDADVPSHIRKMITRIIDNLYANYHIDYRGNRPLQEAMENHLMQLDIRIRYGLRISNPLQESIRSDYMASYMVAQQAVWEVTEYYGHRVPSSEVGYFAMLFEMYQESELDHKEKMNVVLVSSYNELTTQYVYYLLKKDFGDSINQVKVCNIMDFEDYDLTDVNLVMATEPIERTLPVPVIVVSDMMTDLAPQALKKKIQQLRNTFVSSYFSEELFFTEVDGDKPEVVIREICDRIKTVRSLPDGFYDSVMKREHLGHTDLGYYSAIPHPCRILTQEPLVAVAILKKPIFWHQREVRLVILSSLSTGNRQDDRVFFRRIGSLISDKAAVKHLLDKKNYETLLELVTENV